MRRSNAKENNYGVALCSIGEDRAAAWLSIDPTWRRDSRARPFSCAWSAPIRDGRDFRYEPMKEPPPNIPGFPVLFCPLVQCGRDKGRLQGIEPEG